MAIAFDSTKADFKKMPLSCLKGKDWEILAGKGKIHGVKRVHLLFACYIPPSYSSKQNRDFFDALTDAISEARSQEPDAWVTLGGDWNGRQLGGVSSMFPDMACIASPPTRKNATLDIIMNNYQHYVVGVNVNYALEADDGRRSDHQILQVNSVLPRPRAFVW